MTDPRSPAARATRRLGTLGALAVVIVGMLVYRALTGPLEREPAGAEPAGAEPAEALPLEPARVAHEPDAPSPEAFASAGAPKAPTAPEDAHPHPINDERRRLQHELKLLSSLSDALALKDVAWMRRLLLEYRREHANDDHKMQEGYEVIADCLEFPGEASRAAALRYYDLERASTLRRFVRRTCLEPRK